MLDLFPRPENIGEIGPGSEPIVERSERIKKMIEEGGTYFAIEPNERYLKHLKSKGWEGTVGDLANIPVHNGYFGQLWIFNVFGAPTIPHDEFTGAREFTGHNKRRTQIAIMQEDRGLSITAQSAAFGSVNEKRIFEELARVTKSGGRIFIGEFLTPHVASDLRKIENETWKKYGFLLERARTNRADIYEFLDSYRIPRSMYDRVMKKRRFWLRSLLEPAITRDPANNPFILELIKI